MKASLLLLVVILSACSPLSPKETIRLDYLNSIEQDLVEHVGIASSGGQVFCSYEILDTKIQGNVIDLYVWALCEEYYREGNSLEMGTGSSLPVAFHLQKRGDEYRLLQYEVPKDGMEYGPSIQNIFSPLAIKHMCEGDASCYNGRAQRLEMENKQKAKEFYKIK